MQLTMTVLRCPDAVAPETRNVAGGEFSVGRGPGVDWVLPDPERLLSKRHFAVAFRGGAPMRSRCGWRKTRYGRARQQAAVRSPIRSPWTRSARPDRSATRSTN